MGGVREQTVGVIVPIFCSTSTSVQRTRFSGDNSPALLQFAEVNVIPEAECQDDWDWTSDSHICIRDNSGNAGACFVSKSLRLLFLLLLRAPHRIVTHFQTLADS